MTVRKKERNKPAERERDLKNGGWLHAEKPTNNGHYSGKHCGFEFQDGRYKVAPSHYDKMEESNVMELGLRTMMAAHNDYINAQFNKIAALRQSFWEGVKNDYELPDNLLYHGDGWVSVQEPQEVELTCMACGLRPFLGTEALANHQRECEKHPLGQEIRELRRKLEPA